MNRTGPPSYICVYALFYWVVLLHIVSDTSLGYLSPEEKDAGVNIYISDYLYYTYYDNIY